MSRLGWGRSSVGLFLAPRRGRGFGQAIASRLAWLAACAFFLYVPSALATNIALKPSKFSPSTQAACTQSGLDLVCTANPGDQLTFSMAIEVGGDGLSFALQSYEWDEELQDQLDLVEIVHPNGNSLTSPSGTPPVFLQYGSGGRIAFYGPFSAGMQPNTLWESSSQSPGQTGTWWTAAGWTSDTTSAAFGGSSFSAGRVVFEVVGSCPTEIKPGLVTTSVEKLASSAWPGWAVMASALESLPFAAPTFFTESVVNSGLVSINASNPSCVPASDPNDSDGDGAPDTAYGAGNEIATSLTTVDKVIAWDIDNDGDTDVLVGGDSRIAWFENLDGAGNFGGRTVRERAR